MKNLITGITLILISSTSNAGNRYHIENYYEINRRYFVGHYDRMSCVDEYVTKLSEKKSLGRACYQEQQLELLTKSVNYPKMSQNPRTVSYWAGSYAKDINTTVVYLRELVDSCRGRVISKQNLTEVYTQTVSYPVLNPNLDLNIKESFMLVPMTDDEAKLELTQALKRCNQK